ncbi:MAG: hypothetical protein WCS80_05075 [Bacilli bacterium]
MTASLASGFLICSFASILAYFVCIFCFNSFLGKEDRNHMRNSFPYQYYSSFPRFFRIFLYSFLGLAVLLGGIGVIFYFSFLGGSFALILGISFALSFLCLGLSNIIPLSAYKPHIILAISSFLLFSLSSILYMFINHFPCPNYNPQLVNRVICIIIGIVGFITFFSTFNPKLFSWFKMEKAEENGKTIYVKPKINWLAMYEWIFLILMAVAVLLLFVNVIIGNFVTVN